MSRRLSNQHGSWPRETFEALYERSADPWNFTTSSYERAKYRLTLAALPRPRFASALEVGCSIGVLTRALARRCDRLLAVDIAERAVVATRTRCAGMLGISVRRRRLPAEWPGGAYDLIVLSEVLYFLGSTELRLMARRCASALRAHGTLLLVNWTGATNTPLTGDAAASRFVSLVRGRAARLRVVKRAGFRIDVLSRNVV